LINLTTDNPPQHERALALRPLVQRKFAINEDQVRARRERGAAAAAAVLQSEPPELMAGLRAATDGMQSVEQEVMARRRRVSIGSPNGVIATRMPRAAACDAPSTHPAPSHESVALDGLLGVVRAAGLEPARARHPREHDPVEPDHRDAHHAAGPRHPLDRLLHPEEAPLIYTFQLMGAVAIAVGLLGTWLAIRSNRSRELRWAFLAGLSLGLSARTGQESSPIRWIEVDLDKDGTAQLNDLQPGTYRVLRVYRAKQAPPLPGPGVFATGNSVAVPAILPDGSVAPESISAIIDATPVEEPELPASDAHALTGPRAEDEA